METEADPTSKERENPHPIMGELKYVNTVFSNNIALMKENKSDNKLSQFNMVKFNSLSYIEMIRIAHPSAIT